ncbi:MAG: single-stranded DNA-binding protein [Cytophagales bacterium]
MASLNKVTLIGHLGSDPEVRELPSGMQVANFNIATNEVYIDKNGQKQENTEWHRIEFWDNQAKIAAQYLKKGMQVYVEGRIKTDSWEDNGVKKYATKIRGLSFLMLGSPNQSSEGYSSQNQPAKSATPVATPASLKSDPEDDLPF